MRVENWNLERERESLNNFQVSVIICTYNAEKFLESTLISVVHQTYKNLEILIWDDGSTDKTPETLSKRAEKDKRIQFFASPEIKRGPYGGLNFLLEKAKGDYIAIQDHDDLRHLDKLSEQVKFLDTHPEFVGCGTKTLMRYESDQKGFEYYLGERSYYTIHPSLMFRNDGKARYPTTVYMNDALFQKKVLCKGEKRIANLDKALTFHRVREGAKNYSYYRFKLNKESLQTAFYLHSWGYACFVITWELMRKIVYPPLQRIKCGKLIDKIEQFPFVLMRKKIEKYGVKKLEEMKFYFAS